MYTYMYVDITMGYFAIAMPKVAQRFRRPSPSQGRPYRGIASSRESRGAVWPHIGEVTRENLQDFGFGWGKNWCLLRFTGKKWWFTGKKLDLVWLVTKKNGDLLGFFMRLNGFYPLVNVYLAIENHHFWIGKSTIYIIYMGYFFNSYDKLPEGILFLFLLVRLT